MMPAATVCPSVEYGLRIIGIWPNSPNAFFYRVVWIIIIGQVQICQYWYLLTHIGFDNLSDLMDCLCMTLAIGLVLMKYVSLCLNRRVLYDILSLMSEDWKLCKETKLHELEMIKKVNLSRRCSNYVIGLYSVAVFLYIVGTFLSQKRQRQLLHKMRYPFDITESPIYEVVVIVQSFQQYSTATIEGIFNALLATMIFHISGQIDVMTQEFQEISFDQQYATTVVKKIVRRHQRIIFFWKKVNDLFSAIALIHFLMTILLTCFIGFMIVLLLHSGKDTALLIKFISFYGIINLGALIHCCSGEYLISKGKVIVRDVHESCWYNLKPNVNRVLLFLLMRSQHRLTLSVGKFTYLSLECYTAILRASASYISVLRTTL